MGSFVYSLIAVLMLTTVADAATVVGQPRFSMYSAHVQLQLDGLKNSGGVRGYDGRNGYDGRPGVAALFCNISSGTRSVTYDAAGINPLPTITPYQYVLRAGGMLVSALRLAWSTGVGALSGTGSGSSFTPIISASNTFGNNYIQVQLQYSSGSLTGGKRFCVASIPIAVTRVGQTGLKGDPGANVSVTEPTIIAAFNTTASNSKLVLQATSGTQPKLDVKDSAGNTKYYINSDGTWNGGSGTINGQLLSVSSVPVLTPATVSGTYGLTLTSSTAYLLTLAGTTTFTISTPPRSQESFTLMLIQGGIGGYDANWPASVSWGVTGVKPTLSTTVGKWDIVNCMTANTGSKWLCQYSLGF